MKKSVLAVTDVRKNHSKGGPKSGIIEIRLRHHTVATHELAFETNELRSELKNFLATAIKHSPKSTQGVGPKTIGGSHWGVYAFFDYDNQPIYVGQTNESLSTRIRRHLTNQRSDAVAMGVLDPHEVCKICVWPLPELQSISSKADPSGFQAAKVKLNDLERTVYNKLLKESTFKALLNEKLPPELSSRAKKLPPSYSATIASDAVMALRDHPDLRIARRAKTMAKLAQVISERKVTKALRRVLVVQADRLLYLSQERLKKAPDVSQQTLDKD